MASGGAEPAVLTQSQTRGEIYRPNRWERVVDGGGVGGLGLGEKITGAVGHASSVLKLIIKNILLSGELTTLGESLVGFLLLLFLLSVKRSPAPFLWLRPGGLPAAFQQEPGNKPPHTQVFPFLKLVDHILCKFASNGQNYRFPNSSRRPAGQAQRWRWTASARSCSCLGYREQPRRLARTCSQTGLPGTWPRGQTSQLYPPPPPSHRSPGQKPNELLHRRHFTATKRFLTAVEIKHHKGRTKVFLILLPWRLHYPQCTSAAYSTGAWVWATVAEENFRELFYHVCR